jgi:hypothetical protein
MIAARIPIPIIAKIVGWSPRPIAIDSLRKAALARGEADEDVASLRGMDASIKILRTTAVADGRAAKIAQVGR